MIFGEVNEPDPPNIEHSDRLTGATFVCLPEH
jgi:hypothetical protein